MITFIYIIFRQQQQKEQYNQMNLKDQNENNLSFVHYKIVSKQNYKKNIINVNGNLAKPEQKNSIYQALVHKKIVTSVFSKIFGFNKKTVNTQMDQLRSNPYHIKYRSKTEMSHYTDTSFSLSVSKRRAENHESMRKIQYFNQSLKKFHSSMSVNKKRINLLTQYNNLVQNFEKTLPKDPLEQTRQTIEVNQKLIKYCVEDVKQKDNKKEIMQKFDEIMNFRPPKVDFQAKKEYYLKKKKSKIREQIKNLKLKIDQ